MVSVKLFSRLESGLQFRWALRVWCAAWAGAVAEALLLTDRALCVGNDVLFDIN